MNRFERLLMAAALVSLPASVVGVAMTEVGNTYGWWICGAAALLQSTAMIIVKRMWKIWEQG